MEEEKTIVLLSDEKNGSETMKKPPTFDEILEETGEFGLNQILVALTAGFAFAFGSFITMNFLFGADITEHRCWIPECEPTHSNDFNASWLDLAVPYKNGRPDSCSRYEYISSADGTCSEQNFNRSRVVACDGYITKNNERRLLFHLNMQCTGQESKLALLGTADTLGRTLAMPFTGLLSDKFGRLILITVCATFGTIFSLLQTLPSHLMTFELYLTLEFLASLLSAGMIGAGIVLSMEWTSAKYRVRMINISMILDTLVPCCALSFVAWYFADNFIAYRLSLAVPGLLLLVAYLVLGESPQWLLARNKYDRAIKSVSNAARINRKSLSALTIQRIEQLSTTSSKGMADDKEAIKLTIVDLLREKTLAFRLFIMSMVWMCVIFSYYGIVFGSTKVHTNKYLSFALIGFADIPGNIINVLLLNRIGRRLTIGLALPIFSALLLLSTQLSPDQKNLQLILFILGKSANNVACMGLFTFSTEFWPTSIRSTAYSFGAMAARFGSIMASLVVLLRDYHVHLPVFLNAIAGLIASALILAFLPETMHCEKLPETIEDALNIGKTQKKTQEKGKRRESIK